MLNHILVPLDGSPLAECVLPHTVAVARAFESQVTLLRILGPPSAAGLAQVDPLDWQFSKTEAKAYMDEMSARLQEAGLRTENALVEGLAAERIIEFAHSHAADLIMLNSHGQSGLSCWNTSGVVQKVVLHACISAMIVRAYRPATRDLTSLHYQRLLVPLDCSQRAECALPLAATLARFHESRLLLAHVVRRPEMPRYAPPTQEDAELANRTTERNRLEAGSCLERLQSRLSWDAQTHLLVGDSVAMTLHELVEQENVDLVVLSAHGYSGGSKWPYGSVALSFLTYGATPLLVVQDLPPDEMEVTPAEMAAGEYKGH